MKRRNLSGKAVTFLAVLSMCVFLFTACQSSSSTSSQTTSSSTKSETQTGDKPSAEQRKTQLQTSIKPLVTAGTITQDQANKILEALTTVPSGSEQNKSSDNQQSSNKDTKQNKPQDNRLAKLVSEGVITQAQSDAVMQKIKESFPHRDNGQDSGSENSSSESSN